MARRATVVVLDGLGAGNAPDAADFGDEGANTLANTARAVGGLDAPNLRALGLGNVERIDGVPPTGSPMPRTGSWSSSRRQRPKVAVTLVKRVGGAFLCTLIRARPFLPGAETYPTGRASPLDQALRRRRVG